MLKRVAFLLSSLLIGGCLQQPNVKSMPQQPQGREPDLHAAQRTFPEHGTYLLDEKSVPADFIVTYTYRGASTYPESKSYTIALKANGKSSISSGNKQEEFSISHQQLEQLFRAMVEYKMFTVEPSKLTILRDYLQGLFGVGGSHVVLGTQADRTKNEYPAIPFQIREKTIDVERFLHTKGLPETITRVIVEGAIMEAKNISSLFDDIEAFVPTEARAKVGL